MSTPIRLVIVDDNQDIHDSIRHIIANDDDIMLVGQALNGESGLKLCQIAKPDIVLMDVILPEMTGAETTVAILKRLPETRVLALSSFREYEHIRMMLESGSIGYLTKDSLVQDLVTTIRSIMLGNTVLSSKVADTIFQTVASNDKFDDFNLTKRELQVLKLMAKGLTYKIIARELRISIPTVRFHGNNILEKLEVKTRSQALVLAAKHKLV